MSRQSHHPDPAHRRRSSASPGDCSARHGPAHPGGPPPRPALLLALVVYSIIDPSKTWTNLARMLGVGRGADLILYGLAVAFLGFVVTTYQRFRAMETRLHPPRPADRPRRGTPRRPTASPSTGPAATLCRRSSPVPEREGSRCRLIRALPAAPSHDDAYVVDTRRRPKRAAAEHGPHARRSARAGPDRYDADVVDTRGLVARAAVPPGPRRTGRRAAGARDASCSSSLLVLLLAWIGFMVWVPMHAWGSVNKVDNIPDGDRPTDTSGYNYLLVGSDSREGLTAAQRKKYARRRRERPAHRHDHPRARLRERPGSRSDLAAPRLLPADPRARPEQDQRGLSHRRTQAAGEHPRAGHRHPIDGYVEIGFGGFAGVVDSLGGVDLCVPRDMKDKKAGIDLKKGCQTLNGRTPWATCGRATPTRKGDLGRAERQRQFLGALMKKAATPATVLIPWRYKSFADTSAAGLAVGRAPGSSTRPRAPGDAPRQQ